MNYIYLDQGSREIYVINFTSEIYDETERLQLRGTHKFHINFMFSVLLAPLLAPVLVPVLVRTHARRR
jgi:hypothetical protein